MIEKFKRIVALVSCGLSLLFIFTLLSSCTTDMAASEVDSGQASLNQIRTVVTNLLDGPRTVSENQREYVSKYFSPKKDAKFDPETAKERVYVTIYILGNRRPYDIEVRAFVEKLTPDGYEDAGEDAKTAEQFAKSLKNRLNQSRANRNILDDFRPF